MKNRIDFVAFISATNCNPNGDPNADNRPRTDSFGYGIISDECIKRKIRNRLSAMGENIFYQSCGSETDEFRSLKKRYESVVGKERNEEIVRKIITEKFIDNRLFGAMCAFSGGTSVGVRGPVTFAITRSIDPVEIVEMGITKSMNGDSSAKKSSNDADRDTDNDENNKKSSDTMGTKHMIAHGLYKVCGSVSVELAEKIYGKNGAENPNMNLDYDIAMLKDAIISMFVDDESAARPAGSMEVVNLYWFNHSNRWGNCNQRKVFDSVSATPTVERPNSIDDYTFSVTPIDGVECEIISGF